MVLCRQHILTMTAAMMLPVMHAATAGGADRADGAGVVRMRSPLQTTRVNTARLDTADIAAEPQIQPSTRVARVDKSQFSIAFHPDPAETRRLRLREVRLYVSVDGGRTWQHAQSIAPTASAFRLRAPSDGTYGFAVRKVDGAGRLHPGGALTSEMEVTVNTRVNATAVAATVQKPVDPIPPAPPAVAETTQVSQTSPGVPPAPAASGAQSTRTAPNYADSNVPSQGRRRRRPASTALTADSPKPVVRDPRRFIQKGVVSWKTLKERNVVMQEHDYSCGAAAMATVAKYFWGSPVTEEQFLESIFERLDEKEANDRVRNGLSMTDLRLAAVDRGFVASIGKSTFAELTRAKVPVVVRIISDEYKHFVVVRGVVGDRVFLADPERGNIRMSSTKFLCQWNNGSAVDGPILVIAKKGVDPPTDAPLLVHPRYCSPVEHERQAGRRALMWQNVRPQTVR